MLTQTLVDKVINIREPEARAGASLALGSIQNYVGGMAAGSQLKTIVGIFHSLAADPHPLVHKYALFALWMTIDSAGLIYGVHVNSTLALVSKLFMSECHEMTAPLANTSNAESNSEVYPCLGRILYSLLGVVGPELSDSAKTRDLCTSLYEELKNDRDPFVMVEALKCIQHFILFSPKHLDINSLVPFLQLQLTSSNRHSYLKRKSAITCLYQLVQRDPENVLKAAVKNQLEEQLFSLLDVEPDNAVQLEIKDILLLLLKYVAPISYSRWLDLCKGILSRTNSTTVSESHGVGPERQDDDETYRVAEVSPSVKPNADLVVLIPRWRTQVFALNCLRDVLVVLNQTGVREHFCLSLARSTRESNDGTGDFLVFKLNELVRIAFNAATAHVLELNVSGLHLLDDILEHYASANDPDFDCHSLLEQYQAQISAALTPAFSIDSAVLIQSLACKVSATYISSGVNKEAGALGRVLKSLTLCLEAHKKEISGPNTSPHGHLLLRLSILNAWAKIQNSSSSLAVAKQIIEPFVSFKLDVFLH